MMRTVEVSRSSDDRMSATPAAPRIALVGAMRSAIWAALLAVTAFSAAAHHSSVMFDEDRVVPVEGTVTRYVWRSPHVYLYVEDEAGDEWELEGGPPQVMARQGWSADLFERGDRVSVRANPNRAPSKTQGLIFSIATSDGRTLSSQRAGIPTATESDLVATTSDLSGVWRGEQSLVRELLSRLPTLRLTEKGRIARDEYTEEMNPVVDCVAWPTPFIVGGNATYLTKIELHDDHVLFRNEFYNAERIIYTDGRDHPEDGQRTNQGHSIGWHEGDTFVVDSRLFSESRAQFPTVGIPSGLEKHVVERYNLSENGRQVFIEVRMEDPEYLAEPLEVKFVWTYAPDLELLSYECDAEVAGRFAR
jgi:Family of unknown function (DUF6152)